MTFHTCDLDLNSYMNMTRILEDIPADQNELSWSRYSKVIILQTYRHMDKKVTNNINVTPHGW